MRPALRTLFQEYDRCHQHPTNRLTHKIAIPLIVFHVVAMLNWVWLVSMPGIHLSLAHLGIVLAGAWYLRMSLKLGTLMILALLAALAVATVTPFWIVMGAAIIGWAIQMAGHLVWEKRSPAFLTNLLQALVGPLYFIALVTGDWHVGGDAPRQSHSAAA